MNGKFLSTTKTFKKVTHVLFDMDGVLLDTECLYTIATNNIIEKYDKTFDWTIKSQLMGLTSEDSAKTIVDLLDLPLTWQEYDALAREQYFILMPHCNLMPGVEKFVKHLFYNKIPIAVATSSVQEHLEIKAAKHKAIFDMFHHIVNGSDPEVKSGKPNPDIFLVCASRFPDSPKPEQCLVIEDAPNGVAAAISAGMQCVMVPDSKLPIELTKAATQVASSLQSIKLQDFGLPPL